MAEVDTHHLRQYCNDFHDSNDARTEAKGPAKSDTKASGTKVGCQSGADAASDGENIKANYEDARASLR